MLTDAAMQEILANARSIDAAFRKYNVQMVISSDMLRAKQTWQLLLSASGSAQKAAPCLYARSLREVDFGDFGGKPEDAVIHGHTMSDYRRLTQQFYKSRKLFKYPNGEAVDAISRRCKNVLAMIYSLVNDKPDNAFDDFAVCIVGHNRLFRHLLVHLGYWDADNMFNNKLPHGNIYYAGNYTKLKLGQLCI